MHVLTLVVVPLLLAVLAASHPQIYPEVPLYRQIDPLPSWWFALHVIQLPLLGLLAAGIVLLTRGFADVAARVSQVGAAVFLVFYVAMITVLGICLPMLVQFGQQHGPAEQELVSALVQSIWDDRVVGNFSLVSLTAMLGWAVAVLGAAAALHRGGAPRAPLAIWVTGAVFFGLSHTRPFGLIGLLLFAGGAAWLLWHPFMRRRRS